jgi:predicted DNA-binding WGR domain protein
MERLALYLESVDPELNRMRWYELIVLPLLDGRSMLIRRWGRIGRRSGSSREDAPSSPENCAKKIRRVLQTRARHGYLPAMPEAVQLSFWQPPQTTTLHHLPSETSPWFECLPPAWREPVAL